MVSSMAACRLNSIRRFSNLFWLFLTWDMAAFMVRLFRTSHIHDTCFS